VQGKQGLAIALNSQKEEQFNSDENDLLKWMSTACLRKLNKERENDQKNKLIQAYKMLFRISINLYSRKTLSGLLLEAEKRIRDLLNTKNAIIIVLDLKQNCFVKVNRNFKKDNGTQPAKVGKESALAMCPQGGLA